MRFGRPRQRGFTVLELLVVIGVIAILMAALFLALSKIRTRTQMGQAKNLIEKVHNALETYNLHFRTYPPATAPGPLSGSQALYYWLTTAFRKTPNTGIGEVQASINVGPLLSLDQRDMHATGSGTDIIDPWGSPLHFDIKVVKDAMGFDIPSPNVYSFGINKADDGGTGDDLTVGK
jgi:prepilin-type N-terminal cleavage/methylation domain-containing protein